MTAAEAAFGGKRVLVVEDDHVVAKGLVRDLRRAGAAVVGPMPTVDGALASIAAEAPDAAVVDVDPRGEMACRVADALAGHGATFAFSAGDPVSALFPGAG